MRIYKIFDDICIPPKSLFAAQLRVGLRAKVAVLALLGVRPVLVVGVHLQIQQGLVEKGLPKPVFHDGVRVPTLAPAHLSTPSGRVVLKEISEKHC